MKEKFRAVSKMVLAFAAFALMVSLGNTKVYAASVTQTARTQDSITIDFSSLSTTTNFYIGYSANADSNLRSGEAKAMVEAKTISLPASQHSYVITGLQAGSSVKVYVGYTYGKNNHFSTGYGEVRTLPGVVTGLNQEEWYRITHTVYISWDKQEGVDGYEFKIMDDKGKVLSTDKQRTPKTTLDKIQNNRIYTGTVRAYTEINGQTYYSEWCPTGYFMTQPARKAYKGRDFRELDVKVSGGKLTVNWEKVKGINKYNVYVSTKFGGSFKKVKTLGANKTSFSTKKIGKTKINNKKKYYVYVEGVKKVGGQTYTTGLNYITEVKGKKIKLWYLSAWK